MESIKHNSKLAKDKMQIAAEFLDVLENDDDVQNVYTNLNYGNN